MKPSYYVCGAGGDVNCEHWDDVNGCWVGHTEYCGYDGEDWTGDEPPKDI